MSLTARHWGAGEGERRMVGADAKQRDVTENNPPKRWGRWHLLPPETTPDARVLLFSRGIRAFTDGYVSVLLPLYLTRLGFGGLRIGGITAATLVGSSVLTLVIGLVAYRFRRRHLLFSAALLMAFTGLGFVFAHAFWPLLAVAFVGTLNPSSGDVSIFLPLEQSLLPRTVSDRERTALFGRYGLVGSLMGAVGALCAGVPTFLSNHIPFRDSRGRMVQSFAGSSPARGVSPSPPPDDANERAGPRGPARFHLIRMRCED